ncbi:hypothetical protein Kpol_1000p21 [Vanderwaltozyma polyspora DSM 70294]|uniref:Ubiquitin-conjugating enzyme E2C-binding protein n=1 Tax=Vanderwaltozyma polyspora (strain ATCC 22028 / DSM 70294 / BCRC 21397 / CBS 2163 / NBRC 10782 / NRRL Y-8283 / UCD 57-17) TaxID=436907 RepID=A7TPW1_VANPO|nr:uncharacterized protein Kpol_1000p21 [Vanderwaltozyma polyspora DSM 70294]EDO15709.1 hypothetical protein Kpol_1000p21 [Vanderwaltozyma polyspora DSM 70294]
MRYLVEELPRVDSLNILVDGRVPVRVVSLSGVKIELEVVDEVGKLEVVDILFPNEIKLRGSELRFVQNGLCYSSRLRYFGDRVNVLSMAMDLEEKWSKKWLLSMGHISFSCIGCKKVLLQKGDNVTKLNSLPSEFWMELMDYWHCHKPHVEGQAVVDYSKKYNSLQPSQGELLLGPSVLCCSQLTLDSSRITIAEGSVVCVSCDSLLGVVENDGLLKLNKWCLLLNDIERFPPEQHVISSISSHVINNSVRYFILRNGKDHLFIWVFAIGINVSFTNGQIYKNSIKLLYKEDIDQELCSKVNIENISVMELPYNDFIENIKNVNKSIPEDARSLNGWNVSYVPLITSSPSSFTPA